MNKREDNILWYVIIIFFSSIFISISTTAQDSAQVQDTTPAISIKHGNKGFEFKTSDHKYLLQIQSRLQFRYAVPADQNPLTFDDFEEETHSVFKINRARLKVGGHAFQPWLKYYWEYELSQGNLLDFKIMLEKWPFFNVKIGQWKTDYNRERVISSGQQQMMDRSLINRPFTLDRQQGVAVYGRLQGGGLADFNYWFSILTGNGRGATTNDDQHLMYVTRLQWNFRGNELNMTASDFDYHENLTGLLAFGAATNRSPYTRFSQAGGGWLEGYSEGESGQYRVYQWVEETALMLKGFSWQQEFHWKRIRNEVDSSTTTLIGNYAQAGYFFHYLWNWVPPSLEIAVRYAVYRLDLSQRKLLQQELGLASNWFFHKHQNKLTMEATYFRFSDEIFNLADGLRFRIQWEISF